MQQRDGLFEDVHDLGGCFLLLFRELPNLLPNPAANGAPAGKAQCWGGPGFLSLHLQLMFQVQQCLFQAVGYHGVQGNEEGPTKERRHLFLTWVNLNDVHILFSQSLIT